MLYFQQSIDSIHCPFFLLLGIQGDDCEHFKLWLENCAKYGSTSECEAQLQDFQSGRKTIQEIFREQQQQIKDHAQKTQSRSYSTDTRSKVNILECFNASLYELYLSLHLGDYVL